MCVYQITVHAYAIKNDAKNYQHCSKASFVNSLQHFRKVLVLLMFPKRNDLVINLYTCYNLIDQIYEF